ncbi:MAG: DUF4242 domain-containing protein [Acidimicrobiia bacterium]
MPLFLVETTISNPQHLTLIRDDLLGAAIESGADLVESRVTGYGDRLFSVFEHSNEHVLREALRVVDPGVDVAEVRLVGATVEEARTSGSGNFLAEWDFPDGLSMDAYLERKAEKAPLYSQVPEVEFKRTYVREDMDKCLCFYQADCEEDVLLARKVVDTPVDRLTELG